MIPDPTPREDDVPLIAGPPNANPPLSVAVAIVLLSLAAPFLFVRDGGPSLWLGITCIALALAGVLALRSAVLAHASRRRDLGCRRRARIGQSGVTLWREQSAQTGQFFEAKHIKRAQLAAGALILEIAASHTKPGKHVLRFGKLITPVENLQAAIARLNEKV